MCSYWPVVLLAGYRQQSLMMLGQIGEIVRHISQLTSRLNRWALFKEIEELIAYIYMSKLR